MNPRKIIERARNRSAKMNKARWNADRKRRDAGEAERVAEMEFRRVIGEEPTEPGQFLGALSWQGADGLKRKWVIRRGQSRNRITIDGIAKEHGWSWLFDRLRRHCARLTRFY